MGDITSGETAALYAVDRAEVTVRRTGGKRYVSESRLAVPSWDDSDVTSLIDAGYAREGRDHVHLTRQGERWVSGH